MAIFKRLIDIIRANINDMLDKAEDPEKMINLIVEDMEDALKEATEATAKAIANSRRLKAQYENYIKLSDEWKSKAKKLLEDGKEELAKQALEKKVEYEILAKKYEASYKEAERTAEQLKEQLEKLKQKLAEAKAKQATLIARSKSAEARKEFAKLSEALGEETFSKFDEYEQKILMKEEEAKALEELTEDDLESQIEEYERNKKVEEELRKLKEEMRKDA